MTQDDGFLGKLVSGMIRRSVRARFHSVRWIPPSTELKGPVIFVANHHGWHDGYLMYHLVTELGLPSLDWIQEFDAFPLFSKVGGMPYPRNNPAKRAATIKRTIREMRQGRSLMLFAEQHLHYPPELMKFGRALELVASKVPGVTVVPVAIRYEMSMHERPEAYMSVGDPVEVGPDLSHRTRLAVQALLDKQAVAIRHDQERFRVLAKGTLDVNERLDWKKAPWAKKK